MPKMLSTLVSDGVAYVDEVKSSPNTLSVSTTIAAGRSAFVSAPFEVAAGVRVTFGAGAKLVEV